MGRLASRVLRSRVIQARVVIQNPGRSSQLALPRIDYQQPPQQERSDAGPHPGSGRWGGSQSSQDGPELTGFSAGLHKFIEGCATAVGSILILGVAGYSYHTYYKKHVLRKMENAFAVGYSSDELAALSRHIDPNGSHAILEAVVKGNDNDWVFREEQAVIDSIVDGSTKGFYHLISGEKGTGKTSMLLKAMRRIGGEGVAMMEAHGDPEIFRIRLGKALDFEFHEDYIGSLFSFKGPRDTTALLDIERAFNKMEKVALLRKEKLGKPLVLIITSAHLVRDDEDGQDLLELIQQRAELWAASGLVTVVFVSDDYWTMERLMWQATRLRINSIRDIPRDSAMEAVRMFRLQAFGEEVPTDVLAEVYAKIGGRLSFLSRVAKSPDMLQACNAICDRERRWLLNKYWVLGKDLDPGGEDQQDLSSAAMLLAKALVDKEAEMKRADNYDGSLPQIPLHEARQIMTNAAWIKSHDHHNIFTINPDGMVQADSVSMQAAMRQICNMPGFQEHLQETLDRLDEIECLQRTREVTLKDLGEGGQYKVVLSKGAHGETEATFSLKSEVDDEGDTNSTKK
ncbi:AAA family ATPase [Microdochium nivale]|nr:AAA family ATPase [Microdochium nivale]